jgi:23S rRNA pseudouridine1911/1915/1917 synthase
VVLDVLYHDNHLLVVAKPAGIGVVPDDSGDQSLLDQCKAWVAREYSKPGAVFLGVVHRLDRPVSGVVCFARTSKAAGRLSAAFRDRLVKKVYWGVSDGAPEEEAGELVQWLVKDRERNKVRVVDAAVAERLGAKEARTVWRVLKRGGAMGGGRTLLELLPETGRSHQLRVAAASLGCVLCGDLKYGAKESLGDRSVGLHAIRLALEHPTTKEALTFETPAPKLFNI